MKLEQAIATALDLTRDLRGAVQTQNMVKCDDLSSRRARAMIDFEKAHLEASAAEREQCAANIKALQRDDKILQELSADTLTLVAGEFRDQLGLPARASKPAGGDPLQACLDRKA